MSGPFRHRAHPDGMFDVLDSEGRVLVSLLCSARVDKPTLIVAAVIVELERLERDG